MKVSVFGLGYVGTVTIGCLAADGHSLIAVDVNADKVAALNAGRCPIVEEGVETLLADAMRDGRIRATMDALDAVSNSEVSLVCVGTPSRPNGSLDLSAVERVAASIGTALAATSAPHLVIVRSTMLPGSVRGIVMPLLEKYSRKDIGESFSVAYNPEFLREGTSVSDFYNPPYTLVGCLSSESVAPIGELYSSVKAETIHVDIETAEMVKYVSNAFHAVKITFANEVGALSGSMNVDSRRVMEIVCRDTKLNIAPRYLRPGFAFGGSCLPKDLRALTHKGQQMDVPTPMLSSVLDSNKLQIERAANVIHSLKAGRRIGLIGLSFKEGTDDLRESPLVTLAEWLLGKGYELRIYDGAVRIAALTGANRAYIEREIPHIESLLAETVEEVVSHADVLVVGHGGESAASAASLIPPHVVVVDLVGVDRLREAGVANYVRLIP